MPVPKPDDGRPDAGHRLDSGQALPPDLTQIDERLSALAKGSTAGFPSEAPVASDANAYGKGVKLVSEFVAGIIVGGGLGWGLDRLAGVAPAGLLIGLLFGFAAGLRNLYRATTRT